MTASTRRHGERRTVSRLPLVALVAGGLLSGCAVVEVAGAAAGAAISVTGAVVSTTVEVTGAVAKGAVNAATGSDEDKDDD